MLAASGYLGSFWSGRLRLLVKGYYFDMSAHSEGLSVDWYTAPVPPLGLRLYLELGCRIKRPKIRPVINLVAIHSPLILTLLWTIFNGLGVRPYPEHSPLLVWQYFK